MKTNGKYEVIARIAGPGLVLGAVFALALSGSSVVRAQASATSAAIPAAAPAKAAQVALAGQPVTPAKRQPGGTHEGIKVHGHWTIEVRSPDGKLVSHTEFENALQPGGQQALAAILSGFAAPGDWAVFLDGASGDTQSPCTSTVTNGPVPCETVAQGSLFTTSNCSGGLPAGLVFSQCFLTLEVASDVNRNSTDIAFAGTVIASSAGVITDVQTFLQVCSPSVTPAVCASINGGSLETYEFTAATLPQSGSGTPCGGTGQISCAVTVPAAGDTINVQVTISFQ